MTRWIESVTPLLVLPANPAEWTATDDAAVRELLNGEAVRAMVAAALAVVDAQETKEGAA